MVELCLHCEKSPRAEGLRLCKVCADQRSIRRLYRKTAHWTPQRDARVQAFVEKAKRRAPLFDDVMAPLEPSPPRHP